MNYKQMARSIRAERRATWEALGRPQAPRFVLKPRQLGYGPATVAAMVREDLLGPKPWWDFQCEAIQERVLSQILKLEKEKAEHMKWWAEEFIRLKSN